MNAVEIKQAIPNLAKPAAAKRAEAAAPAKKAARRETA
jgi:hypothetical protein